MHNKPFSVNLSVAILICRLQLLSLRRQSKSFFFPTIHLPSLVFQEKKWVVYKLPSSRESLKL